MTFRARKACMGSILKGQIAQFSTKHSDNFCGKFSLMEAEMKTEKMAAEAQIFSLAWAQFYKTLRREAMRR